MNSDTKPNPEGLVSRLRKRADAFGDVRFLAEGETATCDLFHQAADTIEALEKRLAEMEADRDDCRLAASDAAIERDLMTEDRDGCVASLAECYRLSGADPDGDSDAMLARHAVQEIKQMRTDWDECGDELIAAEKRLAEVGGER